MISKAEVRKELSLSRTLIDRLSGQLDDLPEGKLYMKMERGKYRPYQRIEGRENYLNRNQIDIVNGLANREKIENAICKLNMNTQVLDILESTYTEIPDLMPDNMNIMAIGNRPILKNTQLLSKEELEQISSDWITGHNGNTDYRPEGRIHRTSDGIWVRSKSELIIYEYLFCSEYLIEKY